MKNRLVVYTALFGDYGGLIEQPKLEGVDYICYTNRTDLTSASWKIVQVPQPVLDDNPRSNRYYKLLPHKHLSHDYEVSLYIDANILILKNISKLVKTVLDNKSMAFFDHNNNKKDPRNCIYQEYESILKLSEQYNIEKDSPEAMRQQIQRFREEGYPENNGLITAPVLIRKHFDPKVIALMEAWWNVVANESRRDQLSFNYVAWKQDFDDYTLIDGDVRKGNPWFYTITHRKNYKFKVLKAKIKSFLKI